MEKYHFSFCKNSEMKISLNRFFQKWNSFYSFKQKSNLEIKQTNVIVEELFFSWKTSHNFSDKSLPNKKCYFESFPMNTIMGIFNFL